MKQIVVLILTFPIFLIWFFQPFYTQNMHLRTMAIQIALDRGIEKAGVEGRFNDQIINEMKTTIIDQLHYAESDIYFSGTTSTIPRGDYIEGTLGIPAGQLDVFDWNKGEIKRLAVYATQMSEYIQR